MQQQMLTLKEVQERLRIGRSTLRTIINTDSDFRTMKVGHRRLMSEAALARYIEAKENASH